MNANGHDGLALKDTMKHIIEATVDISTVKPLDSAERIIVRLVEKDLKALWRRCDALIEES